jgi:hypothetical protein
MNIDRRQFIQGILAAGVVLGGTTVIAQTAQAGTTRTTLGSTESFLLATGRRALG